MTSKSFLTPLFLSFCMTISLTACGQNVEGTTEKANAAININDSKQLRQDIGEMLLVGFRGTTIDDKSTIVRDIREYYVGSIILFEYDAPTGTRHRNIESPKQLKQLCADLQKYGNNNLLILKISGGEMAIESHSQIGDVFEKLDIQQDGADLNIAFNVKYLTDVVRYIDAEQIQINLNNAISPCIITPVGDEDYLHLVLPVRTGATA